MSHRFLACRACGAITSQVSGVGRRTLLVAACRRTMPAGAESRLRRFLGGGLPSGFCSWPDEGRDSSEHAIIALLAHSGAQWAFSVALGPSS